MSTPLVASVRLRDASSIDFAYDNLGRLTQKTVPERSGLDGSHTRDVYYAYDLLGRLTEARFGSLSGLGVSNSWDALGRLASTSTNMDGTARALSYHYDAAGRRTRITHPDSAYFVYDRDVLGRLIGIDENGSSDIQNQSYYATGELYLDGRAGSARGWLYDDVGRPRYQIDDLPSSAGTNWTLARNPAGQVVSNVRSNDDYAWGGHYQVNRSYTADGLNRYTQATSGGGTTNYSFDANGNLAGDGTNGWTYDRENRLVASSAGPVLTYDPLGRLYQVTSGSNTTRFLWDGWTLVAEYDGSGAVTERYVHGDGPSTGSGDNPIFWYHGSSVGSTNRRQLYADPHGSIVAITDAAGNRTNVNSYDEYGIPASGNTGRFQYTGLPWLPELGMQYSRNRIYSPTMGRFMQTDPIGMAGGINLYGYVLNDPVNLADPLGLSPPEPEPEQNVLVELDACDLGRLFDADDRACANWGASGMTAYFGGVGVAVTDTPIVQNLQCPNGVSMRVTSTYNRTNIQMRASVNFVGPGAADSASAYIGGVPDIWGVTDGDYSISLDLSIGAGFDAYITNDQYTTELAYPESGRLILPHIGISANRRDLNVRQAGHGFAHMFGMIDRYKQVPGAPISIWPGYERGSLMSVGYSSPVTAQTMKDGIIACQSPGGA